MQSGVNEELALEFNLPRLVRTAALRPLLLQLVGWRNEGTADERRLDTLLAHYHASTTARLVGARIGGTLVGMLALDLATPRRAVIGQIVVDAGQRGRGVGRAMIDAAAIRWALTVLEAETHDAASDFYRRCGFRVQSLGEKYPGVERFHCLRGGES